VIEVAVTCKNDKLRLISALKETEMPYKVKISKGGTRSLEQNAYLWGVCYETILNQGGLKDLGWRNDDVHEYFLGEHFGWETLSGLGRKRVRPLHRSSTLSTVEFMDYVAFIQEKAAGMGIVIPDPE
jgi:hypothetical protein